ncbi:MAG: thioredoxin domain-containing protein [Candidatus Eremiobacteraeota bacterium]|nr:thioredoxin domain-containing protein [Candidatus Eremiobacteraeota bacterium]
MKRKLGCRRTSIAMEFHFSPRPNRANEIAWRPWNAQAFAEAKGQDKPVLLAISAAWCHWCHVMDETTYSNPDVARLINEHFIPIRVDNDQRPDINARYNMGGWPTTALLTPAGMTLTGGTYVPEGQMLQMLERVEQFYREHRSDIAARIGELQTQPRRPSTSGEPRDSMVARVVEEISVSYDDVYGGFGTQPKFPQTEALELLLLEYRLFRDERLRNIVAKTMDGMSAGGMYDHVEGGFFRYSTTRDWSVPHFEKMSEDHAGLLRVLATLVLLGEDSQFKPTLRSATDYVLAVLRNPDSPFFAGSQDADEDYYALPLEERRKKQMPYVDRTVYANWNASLASALLSVAVALDDDTVGDTAAAVVTALHDRMRDADGLLYHFLPPGGTPQTRGLLTDQTAYLRALIDAYEYSGEAAFLSGARDLIDALDGRFPHSDGPYDDHAALEEPLGNLIFTDRPLQENAIIADSLLRLAALTSSQIYREKAEAVLRAYARTYGQAGSFAAGYARAVRRYLTPPPTLNIVARESDETSLRMTALRLNEPLLSIATLDPSDRAALEERGYDANAVPAAYFCRGTVCAPPAHDAAELRRLIERTNEAIPVGAAPQTDQN